MRYVSSLPEAEVITLTELMRNGKNVRARMRGHAILLSSEGFDINLIGRIFFVGRDAVSSWLTRWEELGIVGLLDEARDGRPSKLTEDEKEWVKELIEANPRAIKTVIAELEKKTGKKVSKETIKRIAKKTRLIWKRVRHSLKKKRNQADFDIAKAEIEELRRQEMSGEIDLYFFDGSGFSLSSSVPYAWQPVGQSIEIPKSKSKRINVLGFLSITNAFDSYVFEGNVDSEMIIACFEKFSLSLKKKTWIVIDNAPPHTSKLFKEKLEHWRKIGMHIKYLPPYSPELNLIEILWRFMKYSWISFSAYSCFSSLKTEIDRVLCEVGGKYKITFV
jgi:transposase